MIQFPKATIENIKVFVGKVPRHLVDIFFLVHLVKGVQQIGSSHLTRRDATRMTLVYHVKYASNDSDGVLFLKLGMIGQKLEALTTSIDMR
jgi:hypothetical protein